MMRRGKLTAMFLSAVLTTLIAAADAAGQAGDAENGEVIYGKRCVLCHGEDGDGDTGVAERLNPPPRDFTEGQYKIKTTGFEDIVPNDADLFRMIRDGMPGTAMPRWDDMLSEQEMWDLVAYIKTFAGLEEEVPSQQVDYGAEIASSAESIATGQKLFIDRCAECHGDEGKGDGIKKIKDDAGARTWPRNLTKPWTYRASNNAKDIFTRISVGIPTTQMPSFADPKSKKVLSIEQRWHVANYVASIAESEKVVRAENTVVKAERIEGEPPASPDDPRWAESLPTTFFLLPQLIAKERHFTPINDTITLRALYGEGQIAILLEWDDRTKSIPGDPAAEKLAEDEVDEDMVAVQLPTEILEGMEKPYFGMGDALHPVNLWRWQSGTADGSESAKLMNAKGFGEIEEREAATAGLEAKGLYHKGTWKVVMKRPLATSETGQDLQFEEGTFIPIAIAAWDGSNGEKGSKYTMTTWYWLLLTPPTGYQPLFAALVVLIVIGAGEIWWARTAGKKVSPPGA